MSEKQFEYACQNGDIETLKELIEQGFDIDFYFNDDINKSFLNLIQITRNGYLNIIEYLFEQKKELTCYADCLFLVACQFGHLPILKYVVENHDINRDSVDRYFITACDNQWLEVAKYCVEIDADCYKENNDLVIYFAKWCKSEDPDYKEIINYCLFDLNIPFTNELKKALKDILANKSLKKQEIIQLFKKRDFNNKLNNDLSNMNEENKLRTKI